MPIANIINLNFDEKDNKIYTDFENDEFGNPSVRQVVWGDYVVGSGEKPQCQDIWDKQVQAACQIAAASEPGHDYRPKIKDLNSGRLILVDFIVTLSVSL